MRGLEVEGIENRAKNLAPFIVARVVEAEPHPNADKLRLCLVDTGAGEVQVVCGAPNARAGMLGVFAPAGTVIPRTAMVLKASTIRGVSLERHAVLGLRAGAQPRITRASSSCPRDSPIGQRFRRRRSASTIRCSTSR